MAANEIKANNTLRIIALSTTDNLIKNLALETLGETESEVYEELAGTCYSEQLDDLRSAVKAQYSTVRHS